MLGLLLIPNKSIFQANQTKHQFDLEETKNILTTEINNVPNSARILYQYNTRR